VANIAHDVEGYRSLIARPYASVNRAMPGSYYSDVERTIYLTYYILMEDVAKYDNLFQQERKFITFEFWQVHTPLHVLDYDDLVYGSTKLSALVDRHPETKDALTRCLYEIILRRMLIRDRSRSVNSIDVVFNFDCIGFTGTPFIDNYPTAAFLRRHDSRASVDEDEPIPDLIDRSFYAYSNERLEKDEFERRFAQFQVRNSDVSVEYVPFAFIQEAPDELAILRTILEREAQGGEFFNVLVDLCGIFKQTTIHEVRDLLVQHFGAPDAEQDGFEYIYHISVWYMDDRLPAILRSRLRTYSSRDRAKCFISRRGGRVFSSSSSLSPSSAAKRAGERAPLLYTVKRVSFMVRERPIACHTWVKSSTSWASTTDLANSACP